MKAWWIAPAWAVAMLAALALVRVGARDPRAVGRGIEPPAPWPLAKSGHVCYMGHDVTVPPRSRWRVPFALTHEERAANRLRYRRRT